MKTIIVGGGVGGLITALYLSQQGEEVIIYEKENRLGGRLTFVEKDGYRIDQGPTIVLLPEMITSILNEVDISPKQLDFIQIDPLYKMQYPDGTVFYKWSDEQKQLAEISRLYPGEETGFLRFLHEMNERFEKGKGAFLERSFLKKHTFFSPKSLKTLWELKAYQTVQKQIQTYFSNKRLQEAFTLQTLYIGGTPFQSPALYSLVSFSEHQHGIWYLKGGYAKLVDILEKKLKENQVTVHLNHKVEKVDTIGKECKGLWVNGKYEQADRIVLNGDLPIMKKLLNQKDEKKTYVASSGCLLLYIGVDHLYTDAEVHQFLMTDDFEQNMDDVFKHKKLSSKPSMYIFNPSKIDSTLAPVGKSVLYVLIPVPSGNEVDWNNVEPFINQCLEEMEKRGFSLLREHTEWMEVRTPADAKKDGLYQGGSFGIAPILSQSGVFRPQLKPFGFDNVYAVGASTHPGGGIPIVMQGAKILADHLKEERSKGDKKK